MALPCCHLRIVLATWFENNHHSNTIAPLRRTRRPCRCFVLFRHVWTLILPHVAAKPQKCQDVSLQLYMISFAIRKGQRLLAGRLVDRFGLVGQNGQAALATVGGQIPNWSLQDVCFLALRLLSKL